MSTDHDQHWQIVIQSVRDWLTCFSGIAWVLLGVLLSASIIVLLLFYRWLRRGGLKRQSTTNFFRQQQISEQFRRNQADRV